MNILKITKAEWDRKKSHGYTHFIDNKPYILTMGNNGATVLAPVEIIKEKEQTNE